MYDKTKPHDMVSLHDLFCTACFVMATQPAVNNKSKTGYWPDTLPDWLSYSTDSIDNTIPKMVATTKQYTDYEKAIDLTLSALAGGHTISKEQIKLIWSVCQTAYKRKRGAAWLQLSKIYHCSPTTVRRNYEEALFLLLQVV